MSDSALVFDLTTASFPQGALLNSHKVPVLVEFMGAWSGPCVLQSDQFTRLAAEFPGEFIFARVDIDEQTELTKEYQIKNVPTLIVFQDGNPVRTEEGELKEDEARALLKDLGIYNESDALREQARSKHMAGDTPGAVMLLAQAAKIDPGNTRVAMDMVQIFLDTGRAEDAKGLLQRLPENVQNSDQGKTLKGQLAFVEVAAKTEGIDALQARLRDNPEDHNALFDLAMCEIARHDYDTAMNALFHIQQQNPEFRDGAAREMIVTVVNILSSSEPELAMSYRRRLSNLLAE